MNTSTKTACRNFIRNNNKIIIFSCIYLIISLLICILIGNGSYGQNTVSIAAPSFTQNEDGLISKGYSLPASTLKTDITYTSNVSCTAYITAEGTHLGEVALPATGDDSSNVATILCTVPSSTSSLKIMIVGAGEENITVSNLVFTADRTLCNDTALKSAVIFICLSLILAVILLRISGRLSFTFCVILVLQACAVLFVSSPVFSDVVNDGHDLLNLSARIEGVKDAWADGQLFPVIMPAANNGYGYLGFMYPELFLAFPALLRLLNVSMVGAIHSYILIINTATAVITYLSVKSVLTRLSMEGCNDDSAKIRLISAVSSIFFVCAPYRLANIYIRADLGEAAAMIFLPLLLAGLFHLFAGDKDKWWMASLAVTGILQSHILSTVMVIPAVVILLLFYIRSIAKEKRCIALLKSLGLFLLLNLWYIIPFVRFYLFGLNTSALFVNDPWDHTVLLSQLFSTSKGQNGEDYFLRTIGLSSLAALVITVLSALENLHPQNSKQISSDTAPDSISAPSASSDRNRFTAMKFLGTVSALFGLYLLLSLDIMPYRWLYNLNSAFNTALSMLQFPFRLLTVVSACIVFMLAISLYNSKYLGRHLFAAALAFSLLGFIGGGSLIDDYQSYGVTLTSISGGFCDYVSDDYLPEGTDKAVFSDTETYIDNGEISCEKNGTDITLNYYSDTDTKAYIPLLYYPCYKAKLEDGTKVSIFNCDNKRIGLNLPAGDHTVTVSISLY